MSVFPFNANDGVIYTVAAKPLTTALKRIASYTLASVAPC